MKEAINISYYLLIAIAIIMAIKQRAFVKPFAYILMVCIGALIVQLIAQFNTHNEAVQFFGFNTYVIYEWCLFTLFYLHILQNKKAKYLVKGLGVVYIIWYIYYFSIESLSKPSFVPFLFEAPAIVFYCLLWFYYIIKTPDDEPLTNHPLFWINAAHLIYFGLSLFSMGFYSTVREDNPALADNILNFNRVANYILYSIYIVAFSKLRLHKWT